MTKILKEQTLTNGVEQVFHDYLKSTANISEFYLMSFNRLQQLQKFFEEDPHDPFNIYGLALEYSKHEPARAKELFNRLLKDFPAYIPTYYHAAKLYAELNDKATAIEIYEKGIKVSQQQNDHKTSRELQSAYQEFIFE